MNTSVKYVSLAKTQAKSVKSLLKFFPAESSATNLPSGEFAEYACADTNKKLKLSFMPYK